MIYSLTGHSEPKGARTENGVFMVGRDWSRSLSHPSKGKTTFFHGKKEKSLSLTSNDPPLFKPVMFTGTSSRGSNEVQVERQKNSWTGDGGGGI